MGIVKTNSKKDQRISLGMLLDLKSPLATLLRGADSTAPGLIPLGYNALFNAVAKITVHLLQTHLLLGTVENQALMTGW